MNPLTAADNPIIIAIDGFSGCGKSTLAKDLAKSLSYIHIDSGSLYRAITLDFVRRKINVSNPTEVDKALASMDLHLTLVDCLSVPVLHGVIVSKEIKTPAVAEHVSEVAALPQVREFLIEKQRFFGKNKAVIMDGRDIGTVIFPDAELKIFVTADLDIRAERRVLELNERGIDISIEEVKSNLEKRDDIDSSRQTSPLKKADDAIELDTSNLTREEQLDRALNFVEQVVSGKK